MPEALTQGPSPGSLLSRLPLAAWVYVAALSLYLVTCPGQFFEVDPEGRLQVAQNILERHTIVAEPTDEFITEGRQGRQYSWLFLGQSVLFMAPYLAARTVADVIGLHDPWRHYAIRGALSLINPLLAAGNAALVCLILLRLGCSRRAAAAAGLLTCFATPQWWYGLSSQDPTPVIFFLLLAVWAVLRAAEDQAPLLWLPAAGAAAGFALLVRPDAILAVLPAAGFVAATARRREARPGIWLGLTGLGVVPFIALMLWYNWARFGSPLNTGSPHVSGLFGYPLLVGMYGLLLSPGKSILLHAPAVLVALAGSMIVARRCPRLLWVSLGGFVGYFLFYAGQSRWQHLSEWTVRFTVPGVVLLCLNLGGVLDDVFQRGRRAVAVAVTGLLAVSVGFQLLSVSASSVKRTAHMLRLATDERGAGNVDLLNDFRFSGLATQFDNCLTVWSSMAAGVPWEKDVRLSSRRLTPREQLERGRQYYIMPFWWVSVRYLAGGPVWPFLVPPLVLLALFVYALHRVHIAATEPG